ncbi:hypothetical protein Bca4012_067835 [Brassica carinata]
MQAERRIKGYLFRGLGGGDTDRETEGLSGLGGGVTDRERNVRSRSRRDGAGKRGDEAIGGRDGSVGTGGRDGSVGTLRHRNGSGEMKLSEESNSQS